MASIGDVWELRNLNNRVIQLEQENQRIRNDFDRDLRIKINEIQQIMDERIRENNERMRDKYDSQLKQMSSQLMKQIDQKQKEMLQHYMDLNNELVKARREQEKLIKQMEAKISDLENKTVSHDKLAVNEANIACGEVINIQQEVDKLPHNTFFPNKKAIYDSSLKKAQEYVKKGLVEAAIATASAVKVAFERFKYDIVCKKNCWETQFEQVRVVIDNLEKLLISWNEMDVLKENTFSHLYTSNEEKKIAFGFWSLGWHNNVSLFVDEYREWIKSVEKQGVNEYLKQKEAKTIEEIGSIVKQANGYILENQDVSQMCFKRMSAYIQRENWRESLIDFYEDKLLLIYLDEDEFGQILESEIDDSFRNHNELMGVENSYIDFRSWWQLAFGHKNGLIIQIIMYPQTEYDANKKECGLKNIVQVHLFRDGLSVEESIEKDIIEDTQLQISQCLNIPKEDIICTNVTKEKKALEMKQEKEIRRLVKHINDTIIKNHV